MPSPAPHGDDGKPKPFPIDPTSRDATHSIESSASAFLATDSCKFEIWPRGDAADPVALRWTGPVAGRRYYMASDMLGADRLGIALEATSSAR